VTEIDTTTYTLAGWHIDAASLTLTKDSEIKQLPAKVFAVLMLLIKHSGQTVSHQVIYEQVWDGNENVGKRGLTNAIWQLRRLFSNESLEGDEVIRTVSKAGYQLLLPVEVIEPDKIEVPETVENKDINEQEVILTKENNRYFKVTSVGVIFCVLLTVYLWGISFKESPIVYNQPENLTFYEGVEEFPSISHDGKQLAFTWERKNGFGQLFIKNLLDNKAPLQQITYDASIHSAPSWGANNEHIAYTRTDSHGKCKVVIKELKTFEEDEISNCYQERFHKGLDWSRNGQFLIMSDKTAVSAAPALFYYDLKSKQKRQLTHPQKSSRDTQLTINKNSEQVAYIRSQDTLSDLFVSDLDGNEKQITFLNIPIYGLAWTNDGGSIVINALYQGVSSIWRVDLETGNLSKELFDQTPFNLAFHQDGSNALVYSKHRAIENIVSVEQVEGGKQFSLIESSGRDLYPNYNSNTNNVAYISSRTGAFEIWFTNLKTKEHTQITQKDGIVGLPAWNEKGTKLAFSLKLLAQSSHDIFIYDFNLKTRINLTQDEFEYRHVTWKSDTDSLIFSSNRSGGWQLWEYDLIDKQYRQLTTTSGSYGFFYKDTLYYTQGEVGGIWKLNPNTNESELVDSALSKEDWGNWFIKDSSIIALHRMADNDELVSISLENHSVEKILSFDKNIVKRHRALSDFHQEQVLISFVGKQEADIVIAIPSALN